MSDLRPSTGGSWRTRAPRWAPDRENPRDDEELLRCCALLDVPEAEVLLTPVLIMRGGRRVPHEHTIALRSWPERITPRGDRHEMWVGADLHPEYDAQFVAFSVARLRGADATGGALMVHTRSGDLDEVIAAARQIVDGDWAAYPPRRGSGRQVTRAAVLRAYRRLLG